MHIFYKPVVLAIVIFLCLTLNPGQAKPPVSKSISEITQYPDYADLTTWIDANQTLLFATNLGTVGMDHTFYFGRGEGCYYPYSGDTANITNYTDYKTLLYSAGVVLVGKINDQVKTAVAMYDHPEFGPGPYVGGEIDSSLLRVFKITRNSGPGDPDYDDWPVEWGAPVDSAGNPLALGDITLWTIYNDHDDSLHDNIFGGGTTPLDITVQQMIWADSADSFAVNLQYKFQSYSSFDIDSLYICFWIDPDLGGPNDDLAGCDTVNDLFYCYNGDGYDAVYEDIPAAWGGKVLYGPVVPSTGDTAVFDQGLLPDYRNIKMSVFNSYLSSEAPITPETLFKCAAGMDCRTESPIVDPSTGDTLMYYAPGDPVRSIGWVDSHIGDKKLLVSFGPLQLNPSDSQFVRFRLAGFAKDNSLLSLSYLRNILDPTIPIDSVIDTTTYFATDSVQVMIDDYGLEKLLFSPQKEQWITGSFWGGDYFGGSFDYASEFFGSGLTTWEYPDSFHNIKIRFSPTMIQKAFRYVRGADPPYMYDGYFDVPFTVWDVDNDRQLNVAFCEYLGGTSCDSIWAPDPDDPKGGYEFIFIFNSDYNGEDPYNSVIPYPDYNLMDDIDSMDVLYFYWPLIRSGYTIDDLEDGHYLETIGQFENINGPLDTLKFVKTDIGAVESRAVVIKNFSENPVILNLETSDTSVFKLSTPFLKIKDSLPQTIRVDFKPANEGYYDEYLFVRDSIADQVIATISLAGGTIIPTDVTEDYGPRMLIPSQCRLHQNYPNPFNPNTVIDFDLEKKSRVDLSVFNILGQKVITLIDKDLPAGNHRAEWDSRDKDNNQVAAGIYFYRLEADNFTATRKMVLLK